MLSLIPLALLRAARSGTARSSVPGNAIQALQQLSTGGFSTVGLQRHHDCPRLGLGCSGCACTTHTIALGNTITCQCAACRLGSSGHGVNSWLPAVVGGRPYCSQGSSGPSAAPSADSKASAEPSASSSEGDGSEKSEEPSPASEDLSQQLQQKEDEAQKLTEQVNQLTDSLKRSLAEMENVRMRTARDMEAAKKFGVQRFVKAILDVADNLERAISSVPAEALNEENGKVQSPEQLKKLLKGLQEGVGATEKILLHALKMNGVEQYNPVGDKFDPNLHSALFEVPDAEKDVGTVAVVTKRGYKLHDRVIRPAEVGVVRTP